MLYDTSSLIFLSTLSLRRATSLVAITPSNFSFLSTLSLRRATRFQSFRQSGKHYFYPRSPCGERRSGHFCFSWLDAISIHALLAESDNWKCFMQTAPRYFYPRSPCGERLYLVRGLRPNWRISIHALLAESDFIFSLPLVLSFLFLSTLSLRRATRLGLLGWLRTLISIHALLAESDVTVLGIQHRVGISIHALLAESDFKPPIKSHRQKHFYPRSPCGERRLFLLLCS